MFKGFFDYIKLNWGYFTTLLAVGSFIWALGVKSERKNIEGVNVKKDITELKEIQSKQSEKIDSIYAIVNQIRQKQNELIGSQNSLRQSYVNYISNDQSLKLPEFLKYMEGLEFQITPTDGSPKPDFKIGVKKVEQKK